MLMVGFWSSKNVPIRKFKITYPDGKTVYPKFRKFEQPNGNVIFKFKDAVPFHVGCNFSWISTVPFEAKVSPIFEPETVLDKKLLKIDNYAMRLLQFKKEVG